MDAAQVKSAKPSGKTPADAITEQAQLLFFLSQLCYNQSSSASNLFVSSAVSAFAVSVAVLFNVL